MEKIEQQQNTCICVDYPSRYTCSEYNSNFVSDKAYYDWSLKLDKCNTELNNLRKV